MRSLLEYTPDAIYFKDREHRFVRVSRIMVKGQGLEPSDLIGKTDFDNFPIAQAEQLYRDDTAVLETGKPIVGKVEKLTLPDGSEHWFSVSKMPRYDQAGQIVGTMGISRDVTDLGNSRRSCATRSGWPLSAGWRAVLRTTSTTCWPRSCFMASWPSTGAQNCRRTWAKRSTPSSWKETMARPWSGRSSISAAVQCCRSNRWTSRSLPNRS